ncbi:MAG: DnaJ domain-containing protein [Candidatus Nitrohelix vancouverensis]|uniref:DnaJ domain-containing protein n=1 Tax=Candidatus Nitrohelix vancouverensis TaxID=2705534 RepID=A0A7T0G3W0_9BACT|nr:MAG: DnaJ domain-containing protein [Candidatus Nitrohelix vancouverensis]
MKKYFEILQASPDASLQEIKRAYRERVKAWHPDRFPAVSPRLQKKAHEQLSLINEAYRALEQHHLSEGVAESESTRSHSRQATPSETPVEDGGLNIDPLRACEQFRVFTWENGDRYEGETLDNQMHGLGIYSYSTGGSYQGEFSRGKPHGMGELRLPGGDVYRGEFHLDQIQGRGVYSYANGDHYEGSFANGQPHGHGVYTLASGSRYSGQWQNGVFSG